jgi:enoyl-CoA hydratase/carnithine racemase
VFSTNHTAVALGIKGKIMVNTLFLNKKTYLSNLFNSFFTRFKYFKWMMQETTVKLLITQDGIATITLSRPEVANALNSQMALEIKEVFGRLPDTVKVVILTGEGKRAFCAGADLKQRKNMNTQQLQLQHQRFRHALLEIMNCPVPVIAAVNGAAYGGGLELALGCDFIYCAKNAYFAFPEASLGIMPGVGGTQNFSRCVGMRRAKEYLFTGRAFSAQDAHGWGMVNMVCEQDQLIGHAEACAKTIASNAPLSIQSIKRVVRRNIHARLDEALLEESNHYNRLLSTDDRVEGINAYNEKRKPLFVGK